MKEREILDVLGAFENKKLTIIEAHKKICSITQAEKEQTTVKVSFIKEGETGGPFARFNMATCELPPEGRKVTINGISGEVVCVNHDMSNNTANVYIDW